MCSFIKNNLLEAIKHGKITFTLTVKISRTCEIVPIAKTSGYDGIFIDGEHSSLNSQIINDLCITSLGYGISPIVRVPGCDAAFITNVLDGGAQGIVIPHINTIDDVVKCVKASKFAPLGERSVSSGFPNFQFSSVGFEDASEILNANTLTIPMIETKEGLKNIKSIAKIEGVDAILIGSSDLTSELGIPLDFKNPIYLDACERIIEACNQNSIMVGIGGIQNNPEIISFFCTKGVRWFLGAQDSSCLASECKRLGQILRSITFKYLS